MTETITTNYIGVDSRWDARALPRPLGAEAVISAWTTDAFLDVQADELAARYGTDADDLHDVFHALRSHLRVAALDAWSTSSMSEAATIVGNMAYLINADSTDEQLRAYADAAEAGSGGPVNGLVEELTRLRDRERADRVFVAEGDAVRVTDVRPYSVRTSHVDARVTTR